MTIKLLITHWRFSSKHALKPSHKLQTTIWYIKRVCMLHWLLIPPFHLRHAISVQKPTDAIAAQSVGWLSRATISLYKDGYPWQNEIEHMLKIPLQYAAWKNWASCHSISTLQEPNQRKASKSALTLVSSLNSRTKPLACGNVQHMYQAALFLCAYNSVAFGGQAPVFFKGTVDCDTSWRSLQLLVRNCQICRK